MARGRKDYDFGDANAGWKQTLVDYEEMEELSATFGRMESSGDATKSLNTWTVRTSTAGESMLCTC